MRKVLIASVVALVLFAVGAFAASFMVNSDDIASGEDDVVACAEVVDISWTTGTYDTGVNDWPVDSAEIEFLVGGELTDDCDPFDLTLVVEDEDDTVIATETGTISGGSASVTLSGVFASEIGHAAVLVNGAELTPLPST